MAEKLRIKTVLKYLRANYTFARHVSNGAVFLRTGDRWREFTLSDQVLLLEKIQDAHAGTVTGYDFSMEELEWCIKALASKLRFSELPLFAIADDKPADDDGGGGFSAGAGENGGEGER